MTKSITIGQRVGSVPLRAGSKSNRTDTGEEDGVPPPTRTSGARCRWGGR